MLSLHYCIVLFTCPAWRPFQQIQPACAKISRCRRVVQVCRGRGRGRGTGQINRSSIAIFITIFLFVVLLSPPSSCASHGSRPTVKGFTTAFPGWSKVASFLLPPVMVRLRRNDLSRSCAA